MATGRSVSESHSECVTDSLIPSPGLGLYATAHSLREFCYPAALSLLYFSQAIKVSSETTRLAFRPAELDLTGWSNVSKLSSCQELPGSLKFGPTVVRPEYCGSLRGIGC